MGVKEYLQTTAIPRTECRDDPHNTIEMATLNAWVKRKQCIEKYHTFNQKGDNLLQDQFQTQILNQNLFKLSIYVDFLIV